MLCLCAFEDVATRRKLIKRRRVVPAARRRSCHGNVSTTYSGRVFLISGATQGLLLVVFSAISSLKRRTLGEIAWKWPFEPPNLSRRRSNKLGWFYWTVATLLAGLAARGKQNIPEWIQLSSNWVCVLVLYQNNQSQQLQVEMMESKGQKLNFIFDWKPRQGWKLTSSPVTPSPGTDTKMDPVALGTQTHGEIETEITVTSCS